MIGGRLRRLGDRTLSLLAALGVLCLVVSVVGTVFDVRVLVFTSGSMSPTIDTGAIAVAQKVDAGDLAVGDVVSVPMENGRVTHRIQAIDLAGDHATLTLKGDANQVVDAESYTVTSADRVVFDVPLLGYVVDALSGPFGVILGGMLAAVLLFLIVRPGSGRRRRRKMQPVAVVVAGLLLAPGVLLSGRITPTQAYWQDVAPADSGTFRAHKVLPPDAMTCANGAPVLLGYYDSVTLNVTHKDTRYDYVFRVLNASGVQQGSDYVVSSGSKQVGQQVPKTFTANELAGLLPLGSSLTIRVHARLKSGSTWISTAFRQWRVDTGLLGILLLNGVKCGADTTGAPDTTGPSIAFSAPTGGVVADAGTYRDVVRNVCGDRRPGCGTVTDASGVRLAEYQLRRVRPNGTEFFHASTAIGGIWNSDSAFEEMSFSNGKWDFDGLISTAYFDWNETMAFTLTVRATDQAGNVTSSSIDFTLN